MPAYQHSLRPLAVGLALAALSVPALAAGRSAQDDRSDPFKVRVDKKKVAVPVPKEAIVEPPPIEVRAEQCRGSLSAGESVQSRPCMYLVRELKLSGVSRSENGVEAFVYAAPTQQTVLVRAGDRLFDGRVVSVREPSEAGGAQLVLEKTIEKRVGKKLVKLVDSVTLTLE